MRSPASVTEKDLPSLLDERQKLLTLKFDGVSTRQDEVRLAWIRWQLDNLEDQRVI